MPALRRQYDAASLTELIGHRSNQGKVWEEVARQQKSLGTDPGTHAMFGNILGCGFPIRQHAIHLRRSLLLRHAIH
jgi:hypothetical protein